MSNIKKYILYGEYDSSVQRYRYSYQCKGCNKISSHCWANKTVKHSLYCQKCYSSINNNCRKPVTFIHVVTGEISKALSITEFCNKHPDLGKYAKHHFSEVLKGKRLHFKGWMLPKHYKCINKDNITSYCSVFVNSPIKK